jgi:hypothetical protein
VQSAIAIENVSHTASTELQTTVPLPLLGQLLEVAKEEGKLATVSNEFIKLHAEHLWNHYRYPRRTTYNNYAWAIVETYPSILLFFCMNCTFDLYILI